LDVALALRRSLSRALRPDRDAGLRSARALVVRPDRDDARRDVRPLLRVDLRPLLPLSRAAG
jgi:hypothetical protein